MTRSITFAISHEAAVPIGGAAERWFGQRRNGGAAGEPVVLDIGGTQADLLLWIGVERLAIGAGGDGAALLCNFAAPQPEADEEFNDWYDTEHLPRLAAVPGVLTAQRFMAECGSPPYLALYGLADPAVAQSSAWREAAATPWTARIKRYTARFESFLFTRR